VWILLRVIPSVTVRVLGPLEIERSGRRVAVHGRVQRRLLAALLVAEGRTVSVAALIDSLWGDEPPRSARNTLQSHVARLRDLLGDREAIATRSPGYALVPGRVRTDADEFRSVVRDAAIRVETEPGAVVTSLTDALELWRGEAFAGVGEDLTDHDATRLEELRTAARRLLATAQERRGDLVAALETRRLLHADDPLREVDVTSFATDLAAAGRLPEALEVLRSHRRVLAEQLGLDPGPAVTTLERELLAGTTPDPPRSTRPRVIPSLPTTAAAPADEDDDAAPDAGGVGPGRSRSYGREADRARVESALRDAEIVTLVGPGGVGKTHLAALTIDGRARARWIDLADVRRTDHLFATVTDALGALPGDGRSLDAATGALARARGTVVIDNCEHLLDAVAELVDGALRRGGPVRLLATSREPLEVAGERVVRIEPLPVPAPDRATPEDPAVALLLDRLRAADGPELPPSEAAQVVAAVGGLPLAIELAAARAVTLPLPVLLGQLRSQLGILSKRRARPGDRHAALGDVIAWSHDLLPEADRVLFRRLAVFAATFRIEDAVRVCAFLPLSAAEATTALAGLVDRSMVARTGGDRYRLLEPLRLDAQARLERADERAIVEERQRKVLVDLAGRAGRSIGRDAGEADVLAEVRDALADVRATHARAVAAGDEVTASQLVRGLYRAAYWQASHDVLGWASRLADLPAGTLPEDDVHELTAIATSGAWMAGRLVVAEQLADRLRDVTVTDDRAAIVVGEALGDLGLGTGHLEEARAAYELATDRARRAGADGLVAQTTSGVALAHAFGGDHARALALAADAADLADRVGAPTVRALCSYVLGEVLAEARPTEAFEHLSTAIATAEHVGAELLTIIATTAEVALHGRHGDPAAALARYAEVLPRLHEAGADGFVLTAVRNLVVLLVRTGRDVAALQLAAAVERVAAATAYGSESGRLGAAIAAATQRLDPRSVQTARERGGSITSPTALTTEALRAIAEAAPPGVR
jgi:predicted ATPase/DNA-binding SARP family transcriptional activator